MNTIHSGAGPNDRFLVRRGAGEDLSEEGLERSVPSSATVVPRIVNVCNDAVRWRSP